MGGDFIGTAESGSHQFEEGSQESREAAIGHQAECQSKGVSNAAQMRQKRRGLSGANLVSDGGNGSVRGGGGEAVAVRVMAFVRDGGVVAQVSRIRCVLRIL